jgi:hypothetical protein
LCAAKERCRTHLACTIPECAANQTCLQSLLNILSSSKTPDSSTKPGTYRATQTKTNNAANDWRSVFDSIR